MGDEKTVVRLLYRGETDGTFYETLEARCHERRYVVLPKREKAALGVWWRRPGPKRWARIQSACGREDAHKADEVLAEGRLSF